MGFRLRNFLVLSLSSASILLGDEARDYLARTADTYSQLKSFQAETVVERRSSDERSQIKTFFSLYVSRPDKVRIETKDGGNSLQALLISNGTRVTEYRAWKNEYTPFPGTGMIVSFSPERGIGLGEMLYNTIADGVTKASIRDRQTLQLGRDLMPCVVVDVEYGIGSRAAKFSFWIAEEKALVLRRVVTFWDGDEMKTLVSSIRALTVNEDIPDAIFEFEPPPGAREVPHPPGGRKVKA